MRDGFVQKLKHYLEALLHALDQLHLKKLMGDTCGIELMTFIASFA
jgi:hypothetical protein